MNGEIDGFLYDEPIIKIFLEYQPGSKYITDPNMKKEEYGIAIKKNRESDIVWFDDFIGNLKKSDKYTELINYWIKDKTWQESND